MTFPFTRPAAQAAVRIARRSLSALAPATAAALLVAALSACSDPLRARASLDTVTDTLTVYAISDTAAARRDYPTALVTVGQTGQVNGKVAIEPRLVSATGVGDFDVAFDLDAAGNVTIMPQRRIVPAGAGRAVGLRTVDQTFEELTQAPRDGYVFDTLALKVAPKKTVVIQSQQGTCFNDVRGGSNYIFAKIVVDAVDEATKAIAFRIVVDPNCGFRSFNAGVPGS